jgi:hypothetical protein
MGWEWNYVDPSIARTQRRRRLLNALEKLPEVGRVEIAALQYQEWRRVIEEGKAAMCRLPSKRVKLRGLRMYPSARDGIRSCCASRPRLT